MGPVTDEEEEVLYSSFTWYAESGKCEVLRYGCTGANLDCLARRPLWEMGEDFNHGTGHGVGYLLNVHEGPNSFRWKIVPGKSAVLEEGMITSDEPGYYVEDGFGIRHENLMVCKKLKKTEYGQFMYFEFLTMVPFDLDAVVPELMSVQGTNLLNNYHAQVYEKDFSVFERRRERMAERCYPNNLIKNKKNICIKNQKRNSRDGTAVPFDLIICSY